MSGSQQFKFSSANIVYLKNLSPLVTEENIKEAFGQHISSDEILQVEFKPFPASTQRFCQIDFKTSGGVTSATSLNGQPLLGLPMNISVIDPLSSQKTFADPTVLGGGGSTLTNPSSAQQNTLLNLALQNHIANAQAVQLASMQAKQLAEQKKQQLATAAAMGIPGLGGPGFASTQLGGHSGGIDPSVQSLLAAESEEQQMLRTIHVSNIPLTYNAQDARKLFAKLGTVVNMRIDYAPAKMMDDDSLTNKFALVEFLSPQQAHEAAKVGTLQAAGRSLNISPAKATVNPREPDGVRFDVSSVPSVPVAYQTIHKMKLEDRMAKVRAAEVSIARKLQKRMKETSVC